MYVYFGTEAESLAFCTWELSFFSFWGTQIRIDKEQGA
jgi:hypothetical protein